MRFKVGTKVEVLKQVEGLNAWCGAEIVSGNGHTYTLRYDFYIPEDGVYHERVPRKLMRPPPPVQKVDNWVSGDVVEVFVDVLWRVAIISQVGGAYCIVQLLGSSRKFKVHVSNIRVRLCWQNEKWVLLGEGSDISGDFCYQKRGLQATRINAEVKIQEKVNLLTAQNNTGLQGSRVASSRTLKRESPYSSSLLQAKRGNVKRTRRAEKADRGHQDFPVGVDQVDAVAYPREKLGKTYMHSSFNNKTNGYYELDKGDINDYIGCSVTRDFESNDSDSDLCSVGSCSAMSRPLNKFSTHMLAVSCEETYSLCSDAESYCGSRKDEKCDLPQEEDIAASIHSLELYAYQRTLEALYASGPLSWEKEEVLTNLRITLNITNDEHLMELKNLISGGTNNIC